MTQRSIDAVTEATTPKPLSPLQDSALGLHNLFHNITLGADTGLLGLANPQVSEDLAAGGNSGKPCIRTSPSVRA
jgi:hypothetical protein